MNGWQRLYHKGFYNEKKTQSGVIDLEFLSL